MDNQQQQMGIIPPMRSVGELLLLALGLVGIGMFGGWLFKVLFPEMYNQWRPPS